MDDDPKHTAKATQEFLKVKKWNIRSPDLKNKTKKVERATNKQQLKSTAVKAWQSITKEETQPLVISMSSRLKGIVHPKMKIMSLITYPHVIPNP